MAGLEVVDDSKRQQKYSRGNRSENNQSHIDCAMNLLVGAAVRTLGEMRFIVSTHFRRNTGNVISPARQDLSYDRVNAFIHKFTNVETAAPGCLTLSLKLNSFRWRILPR